MNEQTIVERVKSLENGMELLTGLPAKVDQLSEQVGSLALTVAGVESQIVQLRTEMADEFSAIRGELKEGLTGVRTDLRGEMAGMNTGLRAEMAGMRTGLRAEIADVGTGLRAEIADVKTGLRAEIADVKDELREDIAALGRETAAGFLQVATEFRGMHLKLDRLLESPRRRKR